MIHDIFGLSIPNLPAGCLLADHYAEVVDITVYLPNFLDDTAPLSDQIDPPEKRKSLDIPSLLKINSKDARGSIIRDVAKELRSKYKKVGAIVFCWGGWAYFQLTAKGKNLLDCVSVAHSSLLEHSEIKNLAIPTHPSP